MKNIEPNLLLAIATGFALALLTTSLCVFGAPSMWAKYVGAAVLCPIAFVLLNPLFSKKTRDANPPLIHGQVRGAGVWAAMFPMSIMLTAIAPMIWPGKDLGLIVVIAAIWFGVTVESALKARRLARQA
ncbi:hypothetical protein ASG17_09495 [Brevundimonas sp. Leaf363]|uniref:hypothetical protein n=1 Tax=Brevundimonas sp. Leaf363 TaxID=1736353 RepID=UPI0006F4E561|nr:hypothetical protein [Brevundimonas sp. Leaf363]KQS56240.1 hypothetical protein ASG17_09495 [Brevundimonas sp. Leaf363]